MIDWDRCLLFSTYQPQLTCGELERCIKRDKIANNSHERWAGKSVCEKFSVYVQREYVSLSPVSIQTQSLALRALRKWKPQETQALALARFSRNKRKRQPIGMLGRSSGNHDWLLCQRKRLRFLQFSFTQRTQHTQRKRLRLNGNRALSITDNENVACILCHVVFNVRQSYCTRYSSRLDVCPSVRQTLVYCVETAQPIVKLSSLTGSPMILVFWGPNFSPEFQWEHSQRGR